MANNILGNKLITQIGILVHDIEKTSQARARAILWRRQT